MVLLLFFCWTPTHGVCIVSEQIHDPVLYLLLLRVPSESLGFVGVSEDCLPAGEFQEPVNRPSLTKQNEIQEKIASMRDLCHQYELLTGRGI